MAYELNYTPGTEPKKPNNVGIFDMIICGAPILQSGPSLTIYCERPMDLVRRKESMIEVPHKLHCNVDGGHEIFSPYMWVAVCKNKKEHISGKVNAVCAPCIENMVIIEDPPFDIKKNVYTYN